MQTTKRYLLASFILLIPFQDTFLQRTALGEFGTSFAIFPLMLLIFVTFVEWIFRKHLYIQKTLGICIFYVLTLSLIYIMLDGSDAFGRSLILKTVNIAILTGCFAFVVYGLPYDILATLRWIIPAAFMITLLSIPLSDMHLSGMGFLSENPILHATINSDLRWRGFTREASVFSILIITLGMASAHCARKRFAKAVYLILTVVALAGCGSKGGILSLLFSIPIIFLLRITKVWKRVLGVVILIPFGFFAYMAAVYLFPANLLVESTTVPTRIAGIVWAFLVFVHNPFGVGFSGFYPAIREYMPAAIDIVSSHSPVPLNMGEVQEFVETGKNASSKILTLNYLVYFGMPFFVAFFYEVQRTIRGLLQAHKIILLSSLICVLIAVGSYIDSVVIYNVPLLLGVCIYERKKLENSTRNERFSVSS